MRRAGGDDSLIEYQVTAPWGVTGLMVRAAETPDTLTITAASVINNRTKDYAAFPGDGLPHFEFLVRDAEGGWIDHLITCDANAVLTRAVAWLQAQRPFVSPPPEPIDREEITKYLTAIARGRDASAPPSGLLTEVAQLKSRGRFAGAITRCGFYVDESAMGEAGANVLSRIEPATVLRNFPRSEDGRMALKQTVLLAPIVPSPKIIDHARADWIALMSPARRRDAPVLTISVASLISANHRRRWDLAPWLWTSEPEAEHSGDDAEIVRSCLTLMDAGRFAEAFALCGVEVDTDVYAYLAGDAPRRFHLHSRTHTKAWQETTHRFLWESAPWQWEDMLTRLAPTKHEAQIKHYEDAPPFLPLLRLPNQTQLRKVFFFARRNEAGQPLLFIGAYGGNAIVPEVLWRRPVEMDMGRFGIGATNGGAL